MVFTGILLQTLRNQSFRDLWADNHQSKYFTISNSGVLLFIPGCSACYPIQNRQWWCYIPRQRAKSGILTTSQGPSQTEMAAEHLPVLSHSVETILTPSILDIKEAKNIPLLDSYLIYLKPRIANSEYRCCCQADFGCTHRRRSECSNAAFLPSWPVLIWFDLIRFD